MSLVEAYEKARAAGAHLAATRRLAPIRDMAPQSGRRERFPVVVAWLRAAETRIARMKMLLRKIVESANTEAAPKDADKLRDLIAMLEEDERILAEFRRANRRVFAAGRRTLRRCEPDALADFERLAARFDEAMVPALEAARDARWQLMCTLAELQEGDEGPVFDDPMALRRHLMGRDEDAEGAIFTAVNVGGHDRIYR